MQLKTKLFVVVSLILLVTCSFAIKEKYKETSYDKTKVIEPLNVTFLDKKDPEISFVFHLQPDYKMAEQEGLIMTTSSIFTNYTDVAILSYHYIVIDDGMEVAKKTSTEKFSLKNMGGVSFYPVISRKNLTIVHTYEGMDEYENFTNSTYKEEVIEIKAGKTNEIIGTSQKEWIMEISQPLTKDKYGRVQISGGSFEFNLTLNNGTEVRVK